MKLSLGEWREAARIQQNLNYVRNRAEKGEPVNNPKTKPKRVSMQKLAQELTDDQLMCWFGTVLVELKKRKTHQWVGQVSDSVSKRFPPNKE